MPCNHDTIALSDATRATLVRELRKLDARNPGPLDVSAEDIRRYLGGHRG